MLYLKKEELTHHEIFGPLRITHTVEVSEEFSTQQTIANGLYITKLMLNVVNACFVKNRFWFIVSLAISSYSFRKNTQLRWITFTRIFPRLLRNPFVPVTQLRATYYLFSFPLSQTTVKKRCTVCMQKGLLKSIFCANHIFCRGCLGTVILEKSTDFGKVRSILKTTTSHYQEGSFTGESHCYSITIDRKNLPCCPLCNDIPLQNTLSIEVTEQPYRKFNALVILSPSLSEKCYAVFNIIEKVMSIALGVFAGIVLLFIFGREITRKLDGAITVR